MDGHDRGNSAREATLCLTQAAFQRKCRIGRRLEFHGTRQVQEIITTKVRRHKEPRPILRDTDSMLRPRAMRVVIRAITGCTRRSRQRGEHFCKESYRLADKPLLRIKV